MILDSYVKMHRFTVYYSNAKSELFRFGPIFRLLQFRLWLQKMYLQAIEVSKLVSKIDTRFTALLSRIVRPEIFFTVGPGFPTTCISDQRCSSLAQNLQRHSGQCFWKTLKVSLKSLKLILVYDRFSQKLLFVLQILKYKEHVTFQYLSSKINFIHNKIPYKNKKLIS